MTYVPAARKNDNVAYSAASQGAAIGHATGLMLAELFIPKTPKELYKLIPVLKFTKAIQFANAATKLVKLDKLGVGAMSTKFPVWGSKSEQAWYRFASAAHEKGIELAIDKGTEYAVDQVEKLGGFAGALLTLSGSPIKDGSPNVFIDIKPAARVNDPVEGYQPIAEGSDIVTINKKPAARYGDRTQDNGTIVQGSSDCFMAGDPVSTVEIKERSLGWVSDLLNAAMTGIGKGFKHDGRVKKVTTYVRRAGEQVVKEEKKAITKLAKKEATDTIKEEVGKIFGH